MLRSFLILSRVINCNFKILKSAKSIIKVVVKKYLITRKVIMECCNHKFMKRWCECHHCWGTGCDVAKPILDNREDEIEMS